MIKSISEWCELGIGTGAKEVRRGRPRLIHGRFFLASDNIPFA
jgi:hypothetical protein